MGSLSLITFLFLLFKVLLFDAVWASMTTFSGFSLAATWVNAALLAWVLTLPAALFSARRVEITVMVAVDAWFVANLMYARTYMSMIPAQSYLLAGNLSDFTASVWASLRWVDALFPLSTVVAAYVEIREQRLEIGKIPRWGRVKGYLGVLALLTGVSAAITLRHGGFRAYRQELSNANYWATIPQVQTLAGCIVYDIVAARQPATAEQRAEVEKWFEESREQGLEIRKIPSKSNLVVIICESLEAWPLEREFQGTEITPNLNAALGDSLTAFFPRVLTQVAGGRSIDCQLLLNAGMYPPGSGCYAILYPENTYHTLTEAMKQADPATRAYLLTVDKEVTWNQGVIARAFGIDTIVARQCWVNDEKIGSRKKLGDDSFARQAVEKFSSGELWPQGERAFVQIVTYSGHNPFVIPEQYRKVHFHREGLNERFVDYLTAVNYTDHALGRLIHYLRSRPDWPETLVVIVGDHEGLAADRADILRSEGARGLVDEGTFTPLIVLNAPRWAAGRHDGVIGQVDQYATIKEMMGLEGGWPGMGISGLSEGHPGVAFTPSGQRVGTPTESAREDTALLRHVAEGHRVADLTIRNDLLSPLNPSNPGR